MANENLMTLSQYAASRKRRKLPGATLQSVLNACNSGRIPYQTIGKNRFVDPTIADRSWMLNTDPARYSPSQLAALHGEPPPDDPAPTITPESVQAEAWGMAFRNTAIAAAVLVRELGLEPPQALRAAMAAVSTLCYALAEATGNKTYLEGSIPEWAKPLTDGDIENEAVRQQLENVSWLAVELYRPEDDPPSPDDDLDAILNADLAALGID